MNENCAIRKGKYLFAEVPYRIGLQTGVGHKANGGRIR